VCLVITSGGSIANVEELAWRMFPLRDLPSKSLDCRHYYFRLKWLKRDPSDREVPAVQQRRTCSGHVFRAVPTRALFLDCLCLVESISNWRHPATQAGHSKGRRLSSAGIQSKMTDKMTDDELPRFSH
jgi:hypothetical protein